MCIAMADDEESLRLLFIIPSVHLFMGLHMWLYVNYVRKRTVYICGYVYIMYICSYVYIMYIRMWLCVYYVYMWLCVYYVYMWLCVYYVYMWLYVYYVLWLCVCSYLNLCMAEYVMCIYIRVWL